MNAVMDRPIDDDQDRLWLDAIAAGGRPADRAIEALFRRYHGPLKRFLVRRGASEDGAEDLIQETFIRVVRSAATYRGEAKVSSWLYQIAGNLQIDAMRSTRPEATYDQDWWRGMADLRAADDMASTGRLTPAEQLQQCFDRAFGEFGKEHARCAEALEKVVWHGWSMRDLAAFLGRTEGATREYVSQCRKKLRAFLEPCREHLSQEGA